MTRIWAKKLHQLIKKFLPKRRLKYPDGTRNKNIALCDGLIIGSGPWICYCCTKIRSWMKGNKMPVDTKECNPYSLGKMTFLRIHTHTTTSYIWPVVKHVYPGGVLPLLDQLRKAQRIGMPKNLSDLVLKSRRGELKLEALPKS